MLQTLTNNNNIINNNAMYINPKKKVLSKWCANHGASPNTSSSMVVNTTTAVSSIKIEDTTTTTNPCTISNYLYSPTAPHLSLPSQSHIVNHSACWRVVQRDEDYFKRNNCKLSTSISLTYSREDSSCLEPSLETGNIVLYSSLRYLLKHDFKLTSSTNANLPQILFMRVDLIGGTIKEKINGVISHSSELSSASEKVFKADSRLQIEKVQSYKQAVHFKLSLFDLSDLEHAICVLDSVSFNVFARKKQDGSSSPKTKKTKNVAPKRSLSETDDNKPSKQQKVDGFSNNISNTVSFAQSFNATAPSSVNHDMNLSDGSLSLLANVLTNPSTYLDDEEEQEEHNLEIDDGEEPVNRDIQLLCTYEYQLKELISHISFLSSEERAIALQSAIVALR